jgi:hypothetical protein
LGVRVAEGFGVCEGVGVKVAVICGRTVCVGVSGMVQAVRKMTRRARMREMRGIAGLRVWGVRCVSVRDVEAVPAGQN